MHRRGTHCGRSGRKNQISRAQCRVKSGTARDEAEGLPAEETIEGAPAGKVHATTLARMAVKSTCARADTGAAGTGTEAGAASSTQQQVFLVAQQGHFSGAAAGAESV